MTLSQLLLVYGIIGVLISIVAYYDSVNVLLKDKHHLTRRVLGILNWATKTSLLDTDTPTDWENPYATTWVNYPLWVRIAKFEPTTSEVTLEYKLNWGCLQELLLIVLTWGVVVPVLLWLGLAELVVESWKKLTAVDSKLPSITFTTRVIYDDEDDKEDSDDGH